MTEAPYSNRQIELLFEKQTEALTRHIDAKTEPIFEQTKKTNGRVTASEEKIQAQALTIADMQKYIWAVSLVVGGAFAISIALITAGKIF